MSDECTTDIDVYSEGYYINISLFKSDVRVTYDPDTEVDTIITISIWGHLVPNIGQADNIEKLAEIVRTTYDKWLSRKISILS